MLKIKSYLNIIDNVDVTDQSSCLYSFISLMLFMTRRHKIKLNVESAVYIILFYNILNFSIRNLTLIFMTSSNYNKIDQF